MWLTTGYPYIFAYRLKLSNFTQQIHFSADNINVHTGGHHTRGDFMPKTIYDRIVNFNPNIPAPLLFVIWPLTVMGKIDNCPLAEKESAARQGEVKKGINEQLSVQGYSESNYIVACEDSFPQGIALAYARKYIADQMHTTFDESKALMQSCKKFGININSCCIAYQKDVADKSTSIDIPYEDSSTDISGEESSINIPDAGISGGIPSIDD
jgi:hypothetical protein